MKRAISLILMLQSCLAACPATADLRQEVMNCKTIQEDSGRLECFDNLLEAASNASLTVNQKIKTSASEPAVHGDDSPRSGQRREERQVNVTSCRVKGESRKLTFYLDNGEVWQQKNNNWFPRDKCRSAGIIKKVFLGHSLYVKDADWSVRVSRVR